MKNNSEFICDRCEGSGSKFDPTINMKVRCQQCGGVGKLDWIENIVGKEVPSIIWGQKTLMPTFSVYSKISGTI